MFLVSLMFLTLALALPWPLQAQPPGLPTQYTLATLGRASRTVALEHPGRHGSLAVADLTDDGAIACTVEVGERNVAARCRAGSPPQLLGTLTPGVDSFALGIDDGTLIGYSFDGNFVNHAWQWTEATGMVDINGGMAVSIAMSVRGPFIGGFCVAAAGAQPCLWVAGVPHILGTLGRTGEGASVTVSGGLAGSYRTATGETHALILDETRSPRDIHPGEALNSRAIALTAAGQALGNATGPGALRQAFLYDAATGPVLIAADPQWQVHEGHALGSGLAIGNGIRKVAPLGQRAWRCALPCSPPNVPEDLSPLVSDPGHTWVLYDGVAINNGGQILAYGTRDGSADWAVLLTPVGPGARAPKKTKHEQKDKQRWHAEREEERD